MKLSILKFAALAVAGILLFLPVARAQSLDRIGVTQLRMTTTNLDGTGIRVAQPEAIESLGTTNFQVNPNAINQPTNRFTYLSDDGASTNFPNALGGESGHADTVAANFYGIPNGVATNVIHINNSDADYFVKGQAFVVGPVTNYSFSLSGASPDDLVVNQSFIFGVVPSQVPVNEQQAIDTTYDNYMATNQTLFVSGAGNGGGICPPSTCYNGLSVAAYGGASSIGPTFDNGRCKPDITAPAGVTSFSTPQVSGAAAVMMQAALRGDGGSDTNAAFDLRTIKALLLNGAVKPVDWTNSTSSPLDARYGAGVLNVFNSYRQLAGGKHGWIVTNLVNVDAVHPPTGATGTVSVLIGWDYNTNVSHTINAHDCINHYYFNVSNAVATATFTATATLVWNRQLNQPAINDLNLFLYNCANSNLVACSTSLVDNVEHAYVTSLAPGRYDLQVWKAGGTGIVSAAEPYALAWQFVPLPTLALAKSGTNLNLTWPFYPAGFVAEANTNLIFPGGWSANPLPTTMLTNGQNLIQLNAGNAAQFFRLHQAP